MSEDSCYPYDWLILRVQLYFSGLSSFCLLMQYLFPVRKQQINFAPLCSLHNFRHFLQNSPHCSTLFIWKVAGTWSIIRSLIGFFFPTIYHPCLEKSLKSKADELPWSLLAVWGYALCVDHINSSPRASKTWCFVKETPQAPLEDQPHFAAHPLLPNQVSQLICSSFFSTTKSWWKNKSLSFTS